MNASKQFYESSLQNLGNSHQVRTTAQVVADKLDEKKEVAQTLTNEFGNQLLGASGLISIQKASKFFSASKAEKAKQVAQAIGKKIKGRTSATPKEGDEDGDVFEDAREPVEEVQRDPDFTNDEFEPRDPEGTDSDFFAQMGGRAPVARDSTAGITQAEDGSARIGQGGSSAITDASQDASRAAQGVGDESGTSITTTTNAITETSEATDGTEGALATLTGESAVADDNPLGLALTGVLGVATLVSGLFIHPHHNVVGQQAQKNIPNNFGVQSGLN